MLCAVGCSGPSCPRLPTPPPTQALEGLQGTAVCRREVIGYGKKGDGEHCLNGGRPYWKPLRDRREIREGNVDLHLQQRETVSSVGGS